MINYRLAIYEVAPDENGVLQEVTQIINPDNIDYFDELQSIGNFTFSLPITSPDAPLIREWRPVKLFLIDDNNPYGLLVWSGYIIDFEYTFDRVLVTCSSEKKLLEHKINMASINHDGTLGDFMKNLIDPVNVRLSGLEPPISFITSVPETPLKATFESGVMIFNILNSVAEQLNFEWRISNNIIYIDEKVGTDYSDPQGDYFELTSNVSDTHSNTISNLNIRANGSDIATGVLGKGEGQTFKEDRTTPFGMKETTQVFNEGEIEDQTQTYLDKYKGSQRVIKIEPTANVLRFLYLKPSDWIKVVSIRNNSLLDFEANLEISKIQILVKEKMPTIKINLKDHNFTAKDAESFFTRQAARIKNLEIQVANDRMVMSLSRNN